MPLKLLLQMAVLFIFAGGLAGGPLLAGETNTKILEYDKSGGVIGVINSEVGKGKPAGPKKSDGFNPDNSYEPGEVIVINPPRRFSLGIGSLGYSVIETVRMDTLNLIVQRIGIPDGVSVPDAVKYLRLRFPGVEIDVNQQFDASSGPGVEFPDKVARSLIRWNNVPADCGKGVRIGMIDAGVDLSHPALKGQKIIYRTFNRPGRRPGPKDHGTAVAGILVGRADWGGLLPGATLFAANMFELDDNGRKVGDAIGLIKAANWLIKSKVFVINLSVAGNDNRILRRVFRKAISKKQIMVAAGGNWGRSDRPAYPAAYNGIVAVTALSSTGLIYSRANTGSYIDFAAPGVRVYTAVPGGGGRLQSGTSFAAPFITATMALDIKNGKGRTVPALDRLMRKNIKDLGLPGRDNVFGWGFVRRRPQC